MISAIKTHNTVDIQYNIVKTILYFDIFKYPVTKEEIYRFSTYDKEEIEIALKELIVQNKIVKKNKFYSISNNYKEIKKRIKGNLLAKKIKSKAIKNGNLISKFPFVKAVFISGSLSKGYFAKDDDIDYFIITSKNRLWLARTLLILYKKIFLLNSKKYFCVNYFMSENELEIQEKNRFTATECVTLIPVIGKEFFKKMIKNNNWIYHYFSNFKEDKDAPEIINSLIKKRLEQILQGKTGDFLELQFMKITKKHQEKKYRKKLSEKEYKLAFKGDKNTSKHHPQNHQIKTIHLLNIKISEFNAKFGTSIPLEKVYDE